MTRRRFERTRPRGMSREAWHRYKGCTQKRAYKHKGQARRESHKAGSGDVYLCKHCEHWHITSKRRDDETRETA